MIKEDLVTKVDLFVALLIMLYFFVKTNVKLIDIHYDVTKIKKVLNEQDQAEDSQQDGTSRGRAKETEKSSEATSEED